jgi:transposase
MSTKLKDMARAALARNGVALRRAASASEAGRRRAAAHEGVAGADRAVVEAAPRRMAALGEEVARLGAEMVRLGEGLPGLKRSLRVHGLNPLGAVALLAEVGDMARFDTSKQPVAYAGLATSVRQSSEVARRGAITKRGRRRLRAIAIRAVLSMAGKAGTHGMEFYEREKREEGAGEAICATARKPLTVTSVMLKKGLDYRYQEDRLDNRKLRALDAAA